MLFIRENKKISVFLPSHSIVAKYYGFTLAVCVFICLSVICPSVFLFQDINFSICQWIFTKLGMCIDILEICLRMLLGKFGQLLTALSAHDTSVFSIPDDNFSKYLWIFMKLGMCIDIVEICYGIANWQILSVFKRVICQLHTCIFISGQQL